MEVNVDSTMLMKVMIWFNNEVEEESSLVTGQANSTTKKFRLSLRERLT